MIPMMRVTETITTVVLNHPKVSKNIPDKICPNVGNMTVSTDPIFGKRIIQLVMNTNPKRPPVVIHIGAEKISSIFEKSPRITVRMSNKNEPTIYAIKQATRGDLSKKLNYALTAF